MDLVAALHVSGNDDDAHEWVCRSFLRVEIRNRRNIWIVGDGLGWSLSDRSLENGGGG